MSRIEVSLDKGNSRTFLVGFFLGASAASLAVFSLSASLVITGSDNELFGRFKIVDYFQGCEVIRFSVYREPRFHYFLRCPSQTPGVQERSNRLPVPRGVL